MVDGLRANILIGNNILALESFVLNVRLGHALLVSSEVKITIKAKQKGQFLKRKLLAEKDDIVPLHFEIMISLVRMSLPDDRNFLFHPTAQASLMLFANIMH